MPLFSEDQFKVDNGRPRTSSLFKETAQYAQREAVIATLTGKDKSLPCIKDIFIAMCVEDPTEVEFAEAVWGDVGYWMDLSSQEFLKPYLDEWRRECSIRRKQKAFKAIIKEADTGKNPFVAAKYLIEEPWLDKKPSTRRRTKETTKAAAAPFSEDIERLREQGLVN